MATAISTSWLVSPSRRPAIATLMVVEAVRDAAERFFHICGTDFYYQGNVLTL